MKRPAKPALRVVKRVPRDCADDAEITTLEWIGIGMAFAVSVGLALAIALHLAAGA